MKDFVEASARVVKFPGVSCFAFRELLLYLYTDRAPSPRLSPANCLQVIELANRLCLPVRAVWLVWAHMLSGAIHKGRPHREGGGG